MKSSVKYNPSPLVNHLMERTKEKWLEAHEEDMTEEHRDAIIEAWERGAVTLVVDLTDD